MWGALNKLQKTGERERVERWLLKSLYSVGVCGAFWTYTGYPANGWEAAESCLVVCVVSTGVRGGSSEAAIAFVSQLHGGHFMELGLVGS